MDQTPPEWAKPAIKKILRVVAKHVPDDEEVCTLLANLLHHCHSKVFAHGDRHASALAIADKFAEIAEKLAAHEKRQ